MTTDLPTRPLTTDDPPPVPRLLDQAWAHRALALLAAGVAVATAAAVAAVTNPRGPVRPADVVAGMLAGLALGALTGLLLRSRWAMAATPAFFVACYEIARADAVGPSVDWPRLDEPIGLITAALGRGLHAAVVLVPMVLGAAVGAGLARRLRGEVPPTGWAARWRVVRRAVAALTAVGLALLAVVLTRPGTTPPILGPDGTPVPGSVAELARVPLGGHEQTVLIRGRDATAPVLLYLAGGPGQSDLGYTRSFMPTMEEDVVFAVWDQRGSGTSYDALDPTGTWTLQQAVADTIELSEYLRDRFGQRRIYLMGSSWGTTLGVLAVQQRPDLYAGYIGTGQMVSQRETDRIIYRDAQALAAATGDADLAARLAAWGEPPYADIYAYAHMIGYYDRLGPYARTSWYATHRPPGLDGNGVDEYGPLDKVNKLRALFDMGSVMYPQLQDVDLRRDVPALEVPVYVVAGRHELRARADLAREWFDALEAPAKQWVDFEQSGHVPQFEEFPRLADYLVRTVIPQTS